MYLIQISDELRPQATVRPEWPSLSLTNKVLPSDCQALPFTDIHLTSLGEAPARGEEEKQLMTVRVRMEPPW